MSCDDSYIVGVARGENRQRRGRLLCKEQSGQIRWIQFVDLFEAESEFGLKIGKYSGNYTNLGRVLVQGDLFEAQQYVNIHGQNNAEISRAAVVFHEAVYAYQREALSDPDSILSRQIVGLVFSDLSTGELRKGLTALGASQSAIKIEITGGDQQNARSLELYKKPLSVKVYRASDRSPISNVAVEFFETT